MRVFINMFALQEEIDCSQQGITNELEHLGS
jgi:hypothetical protein